jgi:hypothetical protein
MFEVRWLPKALDQLADIWVHSQNRNAITQATHQIDVQLARDPESEGESRDRGNRLLFERPLAVLFKVIAD